MKYLGRLMAILAMLAIILTATPATARAADRIACTIDQPISAAALNTGTTWTFHILNATPNAGYSAKVQWPGDPSNGGHPNTTIDTDNTGNGTTTLPAHWSPDGFLPGTFTSGDVYTAIPGDFTIHVYPRTDNARGNANCSGTVGA